MHLKHVLIDIRLHVQNIMDESGQDRGRQDQKCGMPVHFIAVGDTVVVVAAIFAVYNNLYLVFDTNM